MFGKKKPHVPTKEEFATCLKRYYALKTMSLTKAMFYERDTNTLYPYFPPLHAKKVIMFNSFPNEEMYEPFVDYLNADNPIEKDISSYLSEISISENDIGYRSMIEEMTGEEYSRLDYMAGVASIGGCIKDSKDEEYASFRRQLDIKLLPKIAKCVKNGKIDKSDIPYMNLFSLGLFMGAFLPPMKELYHGKGTEDAIIALGVAKYWEQHKQKEAACIESSNGRIDISFSSSSPDIFCAVFTGDDSIMNESTCFWNLERLLKYHENQYGYSNANSVELHA